MYNVGGSGDSALYGVEPWHYYLRSGALAMGLALPLAAAAPLVAAVAGRGAPPSGARVALAASPVITWVASVSALPHKEERFLYPVYPLVREQGGGEGCGGAGEGCRLGRPGAGGLPQRPGAVRRRRRGL